MEIIFITRHLHIRQKLLLEWQCWQKGGRKNSNNSTANDKYIIILLKFGFHSVLYKLGACEMESLLLKHMQYISVLILSSSVSYLCTVTELSILTVTGMHERYMQIFFSLVTLNPLMKSFAFSQPCPGIQLGTPTSRENTLSSRLTCHSCICSICRPLSIISNNHRGRYL